jgi:hypothetical protein
VLERAGEAARVISTLDVTGAASRFVPEAMIPEEERATSMEKLRAAGQWDAPPEGGNFDGGLVSSATQGSRYAKEKRRKTESSSTEVQP